MFILKYSLVCGKFEPGSPCELVELWHSWDIYGRRKGAQLERLERLVEAEAYLYALQTNLRQLVLNRYGLDHHSNCQNDHAIWNYDLIESRALYEKAWCLLDPPFARLWTYSDEHPLTAEFVEVQSHLAQLRNLQGSAADAARTQLEAFIPEYYRLRLRQAIYDDTAALGAWIPAMRETLGRAGALLDTIEDAVARVYNDPSTLASEMLDGLGISSNHEARKLAL